MQTSVNWGPAQKPKAPADDLKLPAWNASPPNARLETPDNQSAPACPTLPDGAPTFVKTTPAGAWPA